MKKFIERSTLLNHLDQAFMLRYFALQPVKFQLEVLSRHRKILYLIKQKNTDSEIPINVHSYIALVIAIKSYLSEERKLSKKRFEDMDLSEIKDISLRNIEKLKTKKLKTLSKRDKLIGLWAVVKTLKKQDVSFRDISRYLKRNHNLEIGHSTIHSLWTELEKKE